MGLPKELFLNRLIYLTGDEVDVGINFPNFIDIIVNYALAFIDPYFFDLSFGVIPQVEVGKLKILFLAFGGQQKFRVFIHDTRNAIIYICNPSGNRLSIVFLQVISIIVCQREILPFVSNPADHFGLWEVDNSSYTSSFGFLAIHCGAPLFVGL